MRLSAKSWREAVVLWIAYHLPKTLAYWTFIRVATAHATTGPDRMTVLDAMEKWNNAHRKPVHTCNGCHGAQDRIERPTYRIT
jgi:hypothetical protein